MKPLNPAEAIVSRTLVWTWPFYFVGALYVVGPVLGWVLGGLAALSLYLGPAIRADLRDKTPVPPLVWGWIAGMSIMLIALWVGHLGWDLGAKQTIKSTIGWAKGYATGQHQFEIPSQEVKDILAIKPALAIWGKQDRTLHGEHFLALFRLAFPNGIIHELEKAGHYSPEDQPSIITHLIDNFVQETTASKPADNQPDIEAISSVI